MAIIGPNFDEALTRFLLRLPHALLVTCLVTAGAVAVAVTVGLVLALLRSSRVPGVSPIAAAIVYVGRCIPLPPLQFLVYFTLLALVRMPAIFSGMLAVGFFYGAPMAELFRSGIGSVPAGQIEAAMALGVRPSHIRRRVVIPIALRVMLPALGQMVVGILISSSFVSQIGVDDIKGVGRNIINDLFATELWMVVAAVYFVIAFPLSRLLSWLERRVTLSS